MSKCKSCDYPYASYDKCNNCGTTDPAGVGSSILGGAIVIVLIFSLIKGCGNETPELKSKTAAESITLDTNNIRNESKLVSVYQVDELNDQAQDESYKTNPSDTLQFNAQAESITNPQTTDWNIITNAVGKTTNDIQFMNILFVQNRLKDLLKNRYLDLDEIYRNSIAYEIFQLHEKSDNYWISFTDDNNPQSFNCRIVINPNLDIINVLLKYNDKVDTFYEKNIKLNGITYNPEYKDWNAVEN